MEQQQTIATRLREVIGEEPRCVMSIREFATRMTARTPRPPGSTRAMIHRYLAGEATPTPAFLTAAAELLGVNVEWLAFGIGYRTPRHALEEQAIRPVVAEAPEHIIRDIRASFDPSTDPHQPGWLDEAGTFATAALLHAWRVTVDGRARAMLREWPEDKPLLEEGAGTRWLDTGVTAEVAHRIGKALRATLDALDVDYSRMTPTARNAFILSFTQAILTLADAPPAPADVLGVVPTTPTKQLRNQHKTSKKKTTKKRSRRKRR